MKYEEQQLNQTNVHSLRNIAREVGVKAPTTLHKKDLIEEILQIQSGKKQPCKPTKKGRPLKNRLEVQNAQSETPFSDDVQILSEITPMKAFIARVLKEIEKKLNEIL